MPESRLWIAGAYAEPRGESTPVISPVTGERLADLPRASTDQLDAAVAAARAAFDDYRHWSTYERADLCHRVAAIIEEHHEALARLTTIEQGKPYRAEALADVEDAGLVERRVEAVRKQVAEAWEALNCCYRLTIEHEVFWRLGAPPVQPVVRGEPSR